MASITIRNLDDETRRQLERRAAAHGRSVEEEAHHVLRQAVGHVLAPADLAGSVHRRFAPLGGVDLDLPPREAMPDAPRFDRPMTSAADANVAKGGGIVVADVSDEAAGG